MDTVNILLVEDQILTRMGMGMALNEGNGCKIVAEAGSVQEAKQQIKQTPDLQLVLLDLMLPGLDGIEVCRRIRSEPALADVRIVMLTAKTQNEDVVRGLEAGADDYVTKPFDRKVLLARVRAVLRRRAGAPAAPESGLSLNEEARTATLDGKDLGLTPGEFRLLALLAAHPGRVLARSRILDAVQSDEKSVTERTVDVQMVGLRRKLGRWASRIETIRGVGYRVKP